MYIKEYLSSIRAFKLENTTGSFKYWAYIDFGIYSKHGVTILHNNQHDQICTVLVVTGSSTSSVMQKAGLYYLARHEMLI